VRVGASSERLGLLQLSITCKNHINGCHYPLLHAPVTTQPTCAHQFPPLGVQVNDDDDDLPVLSFAFAHDSVFFLPLL